MRFIGICPHSFRSVALLASVLWGFAPVGAAEAGTISVEGRDALGRGLQDRYVLRLSVEAPMGGLPVVLRSEDPQTCVVSPSESLPGGDTLAVNVPGWRTRVPFWIQSKAGGMGDCRIHIELDPGAPGGWFAQTPFDVPVVQAKLQMRHLDRSQSVHEPPSPFRVVVGVPRPYGGGLRFAQRLSEGSCEVTVCSNDKAVLRVVDETGTDPDDDGCASATFSAPAKGTVLGELALVADPTLTVPDEATIDATGPCGAPDSRVVRAGPDTLALRGPRRVGAGHEDDYSVRLSRPAPSATQVNLSVPVPAPGEPDPCLLAETPGGTGSHGISIPIPQDERVAGFVVRGQEPGECLVTASVPSYAAADRSLDIVPPGVRIEKLAHIMKPDDPNDNFRIAVGSTQGGGLARAQRVATAGVPVTVCSSNPAAGKIQAQGATDACRTVTVRSGEARTDALDPDASNNALAFDPVGTGETEVSATAPGYLTTMGGTRDVKVEPAAASLRGPRRLGAGLQHTYRLRVTQQLDQRTTFELKVDPNHDNCDLWDPVASASVDLLLVDIEANRARTPVVVMGEAYAEGICRIDIRAVAGETVEPGSRDIEVETPSLRIANLARNLSIFEPEDPFVVRTRSRSGRQAVRFDDLDGVDVQVCSSDDTVKRLRYLGGPEASCVLVNIGPGENQTKRGDLVAVAVAEGDATISARALGFQPDDRMCRVKLGAILLKGPSVLGRDLQDSFTVVLQPKPDTSPVIVTLRTALVSAEGVEIPQVPGEEVCAISLETGASGAQQVDLSFAAGQRAQEVLLQGLRETPDGRRCRLQATANDLRWPGTERDIPIITPGIRIRDLDDNTYVGAADDAFTLEVGVPAESGAKLKMTQAFHPDAPNRVFWACSSDPTRGIVLGTATPDPACKQAEIPVGEFATADGALEFRALASPGLTVFAALPPGSPPFVITDRGRRQVQIGNVSLSIDESGNVTEVGSGLMDTFKVKTSQILSEDHTVILTSATPDVCRVAVDEQSLSADETTTPPYSIALVVKKGKKQATFQLHGLEGLPDEDEGRACLLTASEPTFGSAEATFAIVPAAAKLADLKNNTRVDANDDGFKVVVGVKKLKADETTTLRWNQKVRKRAGDPGLRVAVCSTNPAVGQLLLHSTGVPRDCETVTIETGMAHSRLTGTNGAARIKFRPLQQGSTLVEIQPETDPEVDLFVTTLGRETVFVLPEELSFKSVSDRVGEGLQSGDFVLEASYVPPVEEDPDGLDVTVVTLTPSACLVAPHSMALGTTSIDIDIPRTSGTSGERSFFVQGLQAGADCTLEASTAHTAYEPEAVASATVMVVRRALQIIDLASALAPGSADPFDVQVGVSSDLQTLDAVQEVAFGSDLPVTISVADPAVAELDTSGQSGLSSVEITIPGAFSSTAGNGLKLVAVAVGSTVVSATAPDTDPIGGSSQAVSVTSGSGGGCGMGFEVVPVLYVLFASRRRRRSRLRA